MKAPVPSNLPAGVDGKLVARIIDNCKAVVEKREIMFTDFVDPFHREFVEPLVASYFGVRFLTEGGYTNAEMQRLAIFPDYYSPEDIEVPLAVLEVRLSDPTRILSHRDYLGAVLGLGLKRSDLGDILPFTGGAHLVVSRERAETVYNLVEVHKFKVEITEVPPYSLCQEQQPQKVITRTVASLRLDAVLSAGLGMGRSKAVEFIRGDKVKVNWRRILQPSFQLKTGDVISLRGRGRLELSEVAGKTRKGRTRINISKFL